jgi:hypothetical protein
VQSNPVTQAINGDFETNATGWSPIDTSTVIARSTAQHAGAGAASLGMTVQTTFTSAGSLSDPFPAYPGRVHTVAGQLRGTGSNILYLNFYDTLGGLISQASASGSGSVFQLLNITATAPATAVTAKIQTAHLGMTAGQIAYADQITWAVADYTGKTARQKRLDLLDFQSRNAPLYLRNPFGDVWKVNVSAMQVGRLSGVGVREFVDVQIPYSQVG